MLHTGSLNLTPLSTSGFLSWCVCVCVFHTGLVGLHATSANLTRHPCATPADLVRLTRSHTGSVVGPRTPPAHNTSDYCMHTSVGYALSVEGML
eukprot:scaffold149765_cov20-Tisochrysis_lutea.AAC.1